MYVPNSRHLLFVMMKIWTLGRRNGAVLWRPHPGAQPGGSKGSADPPPEMSGGARFGSGARFDINHAFLVFLWGPACSKTVAVGTGLLRRYTLLRTFLVSIPFWKGLS